MYVCNVIRCFIHYGDSGFRYTQTSYYTVTLQCRHAITRLTKSTLQVSAAVFLGTFDNFGFLDWEFFAAVRQYVWQRRATSARSYCVRQANSRRESAAAHASIRCSIVIWYTRDATRLQRRFGCI